MSVSDGDSPISRHPSVLKVASCLQEADHPAEIRVLGSAVRTARLAADAVGVDVGAIANSLIFTLDGNPILILTSGAHRVDPEVVGKTLGGVLGRADAAVVLRATGQSIGGVAPIGHPSSIPTYVDMELERYPVVWAAAGHPKTVFPTSYGNLIGLTAGIPIQVD